MPTFSNLALQEPSTVTARVATATITRGSTAERQEILCLGDPDSSNAIVASTNANPLSTAWGLVVRIAGGASTLTDAAFRAVLSSTQADNLVTATPTVGSTWNVRPLQSSAADLQMTATPAVGSTWNVRPLQSSAADLQMTATPVAGSTWNVRPLQSSAADLQVTATPVAGSTWNVRPLQSSAADLQVTATPLAGSTWNVRPLQSSAGDLQVTNTIGGNLQSTVAASSGSSGLLVRPIIDALTTFASTTAAQSSATTVVSSAATNRAYVYAYSITSTVTSVTRASFYDGATMKWPVVLQALSSMISGANLAVSPPGYLFRGTTGAALTFNVDSSNGGMNVGVAYWQST